MAYVSKKNKQHLELLIKAQEDLRPGVLTQKGLDHLSGMKKAHKILFPKKTKKK